MMLSPGEKAEALVRITQLPHIDPGYFNYVPPDTLRRSIHLKLT